MPSIQRLVQGRGSLVLLQNLLVNSDCLNHVLYNTFPTVLFAYRLLESPQDEVAYVITTASLLKNVEEAVKNDRSKRWQSKKRHESSLFRQCSTSTCSVAAINLPCRRHLEKLTFACSTHCHKVATLKRHG
jgi:hypothetical protein